MEIPKDYKGPYALTTEYNGNKITWTYHPSIHGDLPQYLVPSSNVKVEIIINDKLVEVTRNQEVEK